MDRSNIDPSRKDESAESSQMDAILEAIRELERWKNRREDLLKELKKIEAQIGYYKSLISEMKEKTSPEKFSSFLDT